MMAYIFLGGMAGMIAIRRGDRLQVFVQAGLLVAIVNVLVVAMFGFLGSHDARGVIELMGASVVVRRGLGGRGGRHVRRARAACSGS